MTYLEGAIARLVRFEGGYVNDPDDPGGETKFGISKRAYPGLDIVDLTFQQACEIYKKDYWAKIRGDQLPSRLQYPMLDTAVNSGVVQAIQLLQETLKVTADGVFGPVTMAVLNNRNEHAVTMEFLGRRLNLLTNFPHFDKYGRGWSRRIAQCLIV